MFLLFMMHSMQMHGKGFWDLINNKLYRKGIDAWWMDASEPDILSNVSPQRRKELMTPTALGPAAEYLNAYPAGKCKRHL